MFQILEIRNIKNTYFVFINTFAKICTHSSFNVARAHFAQKTHDSISPCLDIYVVVHTGSIIFGLLSIIFIKLTDVDAFSNQNMMHSSVSQGLSMRFVELVLDSILEYNIRWVRFPSLQFSL